MLVQKKKSGNTSRRSHTDHSVHATRSTKHHFLSSLNRSYTDKQTSGDNSSVKIIPAT